MKLSEAMRKGIECSEPITGVFISVGNNGKCHACALGAAMLGFAECNIDLLFTYDEQDQITSYLRADSFLKGHGIDIAHWIRDYSKNRYGDIGSLIIQLNDSRQLNREQIADWLETLNL